MSTKRVEETTDVRADETPEVRAGKHTEASDDPKAPEQPAAPFVAEVPDMGNKRLISLGRVSMLLPFFSESILIQLVDQLEEMIAQRADRLRDLKSDDPLPTTATDEQKAEPAKDDPPKKFSEAERVEFNLMTVHDEVDRAIDILGSTRCLVPYYDDDEREPVATGRDLWTIGWVELAAVRALQNAMKELREARDRVSVLPDYFASKQAKRKSAEAAEGELAEDREPIEAEAIELLRQSPLIALESYLPILRKHAAKKPGKKTSAPKATVIA